MFLINFYILIYERGGSNHENLKKYRNIEKNNQSKLNNNINIKNLVTRASFKNDKKPKQTIIFNFQEFKTRSNQIFFSFKNRIFGIDSLMVLIGEKNKSFELFKNAINEKFNPGKKSFFDEIRNKNKSNNATNLTMPSITGFLYYTGSKLFVFCGLILIIILMNVFEKINIMLNSNIILTSLLSQLIAYRLWHFGYAPTNTYKFILAILLSILLHYLIQKFLVKFKILQK